MEEEIVSRLESWKEGKRKGPYEVELWPSGASCNLDCVYCEPMDNEKPVSEGRSKEFIEEAVSLGAQKFYISGGEPFLRKDLALDLMESIKNFDRKGTIITNGTFLGKEDLDKIVSMGWDEVIFSMDAPDALTNNSFRGEGVFSKAVRSIKVLEDIREDVPPVITVNMVLTSKNYGKIKEMTEFVGHLGCETLLLQSLMPVTEECEDIKMDDKEQKEFLSLLKEASEIAEKHNLNTNFSNFTQEDYIEDTDKVPELLRLSIEEGAGSFEKIPCFQPWYKVSVDGDGRTAPCGSLQDQNNSNIKNSSLREIWYGEFDSLREKIMESGMPDACENCCVQQIFENENIRKQL